MGRCTLIAIALLAAGCERASSTGSGAGAGSATIRVPPPLPGEPPIGVDREAMLAQFATNLSQGVYTRSNLLFLLCNSEAGRDVANQSGDPLTKGLMRRMVALFRAAPGMATVTCPVPAPRTP